MKRILICILALLMLLSLATSAMGEIVYLETATEAEIAALDQTTVIRDEESPTGYTVAFRYSAPDAKRVRIRGEWSFSDAYHSSTKQAITILPEDWEIGDFPLQNPSWPAFDMVKNEETGVWSYDVPLPSGTWSYRFAVDGVEGADLTDYTGAFVETDPNNRPMEKKLGEQNNSQVYVPFDAEKQVKDNSIQAPRTDGQIGTIVNLTYDPVGVPESDIKDTAAIAVYLPYGYDEKREEPYKVLYISHGSGLESEYSWFNKGCLEEMMDNMIAEGICDPFIVVSLNSYATDFNDANVINNVIPLVEANFNVSKDASGRAMAGLSGGSRLTLRLANGYPDMFNYYCVMAGEVTKADSIISGKTTWYVSGKMSPSELFELRLDAEKLADAKFHITMGMYETRLHGMHEMEQALSEKGIEYTQALYAGGHDWFVWRDCFVDYVSDLLWK